jgi:CheY-like chemotaxis protein
MDILSLPIQVMKDMQSRIAVELLPSPSTICSYVITDKQWLQENLFCLISNAVKYSSNGSSVSVVASVTRIDQLPEGAKRDVRPRASTLSQKSQKSDMSSNRHTIRSSFAQTLFGASTGSAKIHLTSNSVSSRTKSIHGSFETAPPSPTRGSVLIPELPAGFSSEVLLFEVEDTGIGLSDEMMNNLFTPFKQAQRHAGGTGLGLYSLAKRLEALGGYYGVQRRNDGREGSLFWFAIPYVADMTTCQLMKQQTLGDILSARSGTNSTGRRPSLLVAQSGKLSPTSLPEKLNILVCDDSLTILKMSSMMLRRQGHTVTVAENGAEGLKKIAAGCGVQLEDGTTPMVPFDIVLMDLNMPVMDGLEATSRLRAQELTNQPRNAEFNPNNRQFVVGFSANSDHDTMVEALNAGVDDFISKPFALQTFYDVYNRHKNKLTESGPSDIEEI